MIGNTLSIVTQETGTLHASAQAASVITAATPTFMVIFAWLLLKLTWALMSVLVKLINPHYSVLQVTTIDADIAVGCLTPHVLSHWATTFGHYTGSSACRSAVPFCTSV
ncbi:hypothetical protein QPX96_09590 [Limosilactobacillus fermentum]|nr:hypothetical protein [Limosilactobacillus fermentum]